MKKIISINAKKKWLKYLNRYSLKKVAIINDRKPYRLAYAA